MEFPISLRLAVEAGAAAVPPGKLQKAAEGLTARYKTQSGQGKRLVTDKTDVLAYAAVRMPATFGAVSQALVWIKQLFPEPVRSVLDVGAGTGAGIWAADAVFDTLEEAVCLEREENMLALGKSLMQDADLPLSVRWIPGDMRDKLPDGKYDLVLAAYALNELTPSDRAAVLGALWAKTGKLLVLVEPGTPAAFSQLRTAREALLSLDAHILAPCPHGEACPMPEDDWCHFTCRVARSRLHKQLKGGDAPFEDEKFAYLAFSREAFPPAEARVLRHPRIDAGRIGLTLCACSGIEARTVTKKDKDAFKKARKADCGDMF